jgi:hypothetical protein
LKNYITFILIFCACHRPEAAKQPVEITNDALNKVLLGYIDMISRSKDNPELLTVWFTKKEDTFSVGIEDAYPDLSLAKFRGIAKIGSHRVCFVGDNTDSRLYTVNDSVPIPKDVTDYEKNFRLDMIGDEPRPWYLEFKGSVLIKYDPKDEIAKFVPMLRKE